MPFEENIPLGFLIGLIAYITLYLGKGIQKYAIEGLKIDKKVKSKNSGIWLVGTILTALYTLIQLVALWLAPINVVAPLEAAGLIILIVFSYFVLKEEINKNEIIEIGLIVFGIIVINIFIQQPSTPTLSQFDLTLFILISIIVLAVEGGMILISKYNKYKAAGFIIGSMAGSFMAIQTVAKRVSDIPELFIAFTVIFSICAGMTLLVTQFAFTKSQANRVLPCFTSVSIILSIILGFLTLGETVVLIQIIGIVIILLGVVFLTAFRNIRGAKNVTKTEV
jgi:drug/metabolite transporter (DMT)-like permease